MYSINFLSVAIGKVYEEMLPPYIFFCLLSNKNSFVEVVVEDKESFIETYTEELNAIKDIFGEQFLIRNISRPLTYHMKNTYRFFEVPVVKAKYTFIGDVDIMILESILNPYLDKWPKNNTKVPYNNIVRLNTKRLSGLHFVCTEDYYTEILKQNQEILYMAPYANDEEILYTLCEMTFGKPDTNHSWRPVFGIYFSPNRGETKIMALKVSYLYYNLFTDISKKYNDLFNYASFKKLVKSLNTDFVIGSRTIYTALFTDPKNPCDTVQEFEKLNGWDYILFTNLDIHSDTWIVKKIDPPNKDFVISAKMIKWLPHKYLPEYDIVLWIDAYCSFNSKYTDILEKTVRKLENAEVPLFIKEHPDRDCIYDEIDAGVERQKISLTLLNKVKDLLNKDKMPKKYGLYETNLMLRVNTNPTVINLSDKLIHYIKTLTYRDQHILTYLLHMLKIKSLGKLDPKMVSCHKNNKYHKYVTTEQRKIAICFWGLMRSLEYTLPSIEKYIFNPLKKANIPYDIYLHTYKVSGPYSNPRSDEFNINLDNSTYKMLKPYKYLIEDQDTIDKKINFKKYETKGNPWEKDGIDTFYNHIRGLWSLKQVTGLVSNNSSKDIYSHVMYCRPDVTYIMPLSIDWFQFTRDIKIPDFNRYSKADLKLNDRFAIGRPDEMAIYGNRFNDALIYSKKKQLHSELFLEDTLRKNSIPVTFIKFGFIKFGSRIDLYLPLGTKIDVAIGDVVKAKLTRIGELN